MTQSSFYLFDVLAEVEVAGQLSESGGALECYSI